jgi:hypothetical protein
MRILVFKKKTALLIGLVAAAVCTTAVAFASVDSPLIRDSKGGTTPQTVAPTSAEIMAAFPAFSVGPASADDVTYQQLMRDELGSTSDADHGAIGTADFSHAVSAPIAGSTRLAWLVPSGDQACLVLPDPAGGFGASCSSLSQIAAGHGFVVLGPPAGSSDATATVAVMVPRGGTTPEIVSASGAVTRLEVQGNVAAAVVPVGEGGSLDMGADQVPLATFLPPRQ